MKGSSCVHFYPGPASNFPTAYTSTDFMSDCQATSCFLVRNDLDGIMMCYLVGGLEHLLFFHSVGNVIIPTDELIFFRGVGIPPTSYD